VCAHKGGLRPSSRALRNPSLFGSASGTDSG
jgi:hypothetical protein